MDIERRILYLRPHQLPFVNNIDYWKTYELKENLYGITVIFDIDHEWGTVGYTYSVCNGVNFDKYIGRDQATLNRPRIGDTFTLPNKGNVKSKFLNFIYI